MPKQFEIHEWEEITGFVARMRAADLVTADSNGLLTATLMPCIWDTSQIGDSSFGSLVMHMARANPHWKLIESDQMGLAIVHGPQAYISPSNYEGKTTDHKVVPTWNYQSVHLSGSVEISEDVGLLRQIVTGLTEFHEAERQAPWKTSEADPKYFEAQLKGIVAVTLHIHKVEAKYKLSQNRSQTDRENVIVDLTSSDLPDNHEIAREMKRSL